MGKPICFITPNNFSHKAGDGTATRKHNVSQIHPALQANCGGTQMTYVLEEEEMEDIKIQQIGNLTEGASRDNPQRGRVYSPEGLAPALNTMQGGNLQPFVAISTNGSEISGTIRATYYKNGERNIAENVMNGLGYEGVVEQVGYLENGTGQHQSNTVYGTNGSSPALTTVNGGGTQQIKILEEQPKRTKYGKWIQKDSVLEPKMVAMRGRNPENPSDRTPGMPTEQRLELNDSGVSNCLTSVSKDSMVLEPEIVGVKQSTKKGYIECEVGGVADFSYPTSTKRRGRVQGGGQISPTLTGSPGICKIEKVGQISNDGSQYGTVVGENGLSSTLSAGTHGYANSCIQTGYRIRKLTARETWRIQGFSDDDFDKASAMNSSTQLYKQSGNSICLNVLVAIFGQMFEGKEDIYKTA